VNNTELYDLTEDMGEKTNVLEANPDEVAKLRAAYDVWWEKSLPLMVNEDAVGPKVNPFKARYWKQFGGGPDEKLLQQMDPTVKTLGKPKAAPKERKRKNASAKP